MLDGHQDLPVAASEVEVAVAPGVELGRSPERLPRPGGSALAGMVDQHHGAFEAALEVAQEAEDGGDLGDRVLVDAVQTDQWVEDQETWFDTLHGFHQALAVVAMVEAQDRDVDDGDVEGLEAGAGGTGDALEAAPHDVAGVLGGEQQDRSGLFGGEAAQAWDAGGHGDGEIERQEGLAALGFAADDTDGLLAPELVDHPLLAARPVLEVGRGSGREALHRRGLLVAVV